MNTLTLNIIDLILKAILGISTIILAIIGYILQKNQYNANWNKAFNELHELFWKDKDFIKVRLWLASDMAYNDELKKILIKRITDDDNNRVNQRTKISTFSLANDEYQKLEILDKFFNFMVRAYTINEKLKRKSIIRTKLDLWNELYFQYWLKRLKDVGREELREYVKRFYNNKLFNKILTRADT